MKAVWDDWGNPMNDAAEVLDGDRGDLHKCGDPQCPDWENGEHFHTT